MKIISAKKRIALFAALVALSFFGKTVLAVWNGTFYNPGDTLNPECAPTDTDCDVLPPLTSSSISDGVFGAGWNGDTTHAPSKNAVYDQIQSLSVGGHDPVTIGTANGLSLATQVLSLALASVNTSGALSDTDWNTFNDKQSVLVSGTNIKTINSASLLGSGNILLQTPLTADVDYLSPAAAVSAYEPLKGSDDNYVTDAQLVVIGNTSGTNTGDNSTNSLYSGLAASKQDALSGTGFVKISGTTISYDNSTYLTSLSGAVLTSQATPQTIGDTANRLSKLWATDITVTNPITGSITGNAGTVTGLSITSGKTLTATHSLTLSGTDSTVMTFPSTSATIARTDAAQTFTGSQTFSSPVIAPNGTANAPGYRFALASDFGFYSAGNGDVGYVNGSEKIRFQTSGLSILGGQITLGQIGVGLAKTTLKSTTVGNVIWGDSDNVIVNYTHTLATSARGGTDTNLAGGNATIISGLGTGNATSSDLIFQTPNATVSGNAQQAVTTKVIIKGSGNVGIGNASPGNLLSIKTPTTADSLADVLISASATTQKGLVVQTKASQTAAAFEIQDSTGASKFTSGPNGLAGVWQTALGSGTSGRPALILGAGNFDTGFWESSNNAWTWNRGGAQQFSMLLGYMMGKSNFVYSWSNSSTVTTAGGDTGLSRVSAGVVGIGDSTQGGITGTLLAGVVGIGDATPDALLDVKGTVCLDINADEACTDNTSALSDARLKTNVTDLENGLEDIRQLHPVRFTWNGENHTGTADSLGFIAQEVENIFPELVITDTAGYKNLDYSKLTAVLARGIQELDLNLESILIPLNFENEQSFSDRFFAKVSEWLGDAGNGLSGIFAKEINVEKLCVADESGDKTCITKSQLDALLMNAGQSENASSGYSKSLTEVIPEETGEDSLTVKGDGAKGISPDTAYDPLSPDITPTE